MRRSVLKGILAGLGVVLVWSSFSFAVNTWKVGDLSGDVSLSRGSEQVPVTIGLDLSSGDTLKTREGAWIELVSTGTCEVWELKENRQYTFTEHDIMGPGGEKIPPDNRLAVCFNPAGFSTGKAQRIGGIIERGGSIEDELAETKSNAALVNLIIFYALSQKDVDKARPYYEALKERAPGSQFVVSVAEIFEGKTPGGKQ